MRIQEKGLSQETPKFTHEIKLLKSSTLYSTALLKKLTVAQVVKNPLPFVEPKGDPVNGHCPETVESSP